MDESFSPSDGGKGSWPNWGGAGRYYVNPGALEEGLLTLEEAHYGDYEHEVDEQPSWEPEHLQERWWAADEDNRYHPYLVSEKSLAWLSDSCCIGISPDLSGDSKAFIFGRSTLRVKTPVCEVKWTADRAQQFDVAGRQVTVPPGTLIIPSYLYVHKHARYWGPDAAEWRPERWIGVRGEVGEGCHAVNNDAYRSATGWRSSPKEEVLLSPPSRGNYLGWSEGARGCPGKRFSQVEWAAFLAAMFRDWKVEPQRRAGETFADARTRVLDFVEADSGYGGCCCS
ncbi:cytochrome P450 [Parachaetomium inaequale]|uniref:Cytochrome P450 n=1 Tax=Parachaetomium inaequale TaxID=2588326 RepID=A0AAN6PD37_9PEZI|nr:cytochrome P450 [Parachaetomium inaequale]